MQDSNAWLTRRNARGAGALLLLSAALGTARGAHADPLEEMVQIAHHPTDSDTLLVRYRNGGGGLMLTRDGGESLQLIANSFIDPTGGADGAPAVSNDGTLWLGASGGTFSSGPDGCSFARDEQVGDRFLREFANDPDEPDVMYALAGTVAEGARNGLMVRDADGTWSELGSRQELLPYSMRVAKTDSGLRFAITVRKDEMDEAEDGTPIVIATFALLISDDRGESWQERWFEDLPTSGEEAPEIVGIDPSDPDRMIFFIRRDPEDRLLVTLDAGESIEPYMTVRDFSGVALLPDGQAVIGDRGSLMGESLQGLWSAASLADEPVLLDDWQVRCVDYDARTDVLLGCELRGLGPIDRETGSFEIETRLNEVQALSCPGIDVARASQVQLCLGFCGNHFPEAPACVAYQMPNCGPCAAEPPTAACTLYSQPTDAGAPSAGSGGAAEVNADGGDELAEDAGLATAGRGDDGGCGCSALGHGDAAGRPELALVACAALGLTFVARLARLARRTRRRRPR